MANLIYFLPLLVHLLLVSCTDGEKTCELPIPIPYFDQEWLSKPSENNPNQLYYHFAGSRAGLERYAAILNPTYDKSTASAADLENKICLHESWKPQPATNTVEWIQTGFGIQHNAHRVCDSVDGKSIVNSCHLSPTYFGLEHVKYNSTTEHVTLTDNKSYIVFVQCWAEDGLKDWHAVVPLGKQLTREAKEAILNHVRTLGFDTENDIYYAKYDSCTFD